MIPYFFDFCIPEAAHRGIVLLQRVGLHGIKTLLKHLIVDRFRGEYDKHILDLNPLVPEEAVREFLERGQVQKVRFIKHGISPDVADKLSGIARQRKGEIEYSIAMHEKGWLRLDSIMDYLEGQRHLRDVYEVDVEYDNVKIEVEMGDRQRTLDLGHPDRFKASFDVTRDIAEGRTASQPLPVSVRSAATYSENWREELAYSHEQQDKHLGNCQRSFQNSAK
jgi:hypothetical protein